MTTETNAVETTETQATTTAPVKKTAKKAVKKTAAAKKTPAKKAATKKTAVKKAAGKAAKKEGPTIRERVFKLLAKKPNGLTGGQIKDELGLGGIPALLKDEGVCDSPRVKRSTVEGVRGVVYQLTAAGKKAVEKGTIDENAAPTSHGKDWPDGK